MEAARTRLLATLAGQFDGLHARMQTPAAQKGMKEAFDATPEERPRRHADVGRDRPCIYVLAGTNGGKSAILGTPIEKHGAEDFNPDREARKLLHADRPDSLPGASQRRGVARR
jgi:hypothetical protein